jgi:molybdopterin synthase sulfur carrier subunit
MALRLVFLGRLEGVALTAQREVAFSPSIEGLFASLEPDLVAALQGEKVKLAVNGLLVGDPAAIVLNDGDELAFLPPVSGG